MKSLKMTKEKFQKGLEVGDIFTERYSFYLIIIDMKPNGNIISLIHHPGNQWSDDIKKFKDPKEFENHCKYRSIDSYWLEYFKTDTELVDVLTKEYIKNLKTSDRRNLLIDLIYTE